MYPKIKNTRILLLMFAMCSFWTLANGIPPRKFIKTIDETDQTKWIDLRKDHYSIELVGGRIYSKDKLLEGLLSKNVSLIGSFEQTVQFFDRKTSLTFAKVFQEQDITSRIDRPLVGTALPLVDRVPGDGTSNIKISYMVNKEDKLLPMFDAVTTGGKALEKTADMFSQPWVGYTELALQLVSKFIDANKPKSPILLETAVPEIAVMKEGGRFVVPYYLIFVAPNGDGDKQVINDMQAQDLTVDGDSLLWKTKPVVDKTYIILRVTGSLGYDIPSMLNRSGDAWAEFAKAQFLTTPALKIENAAQLSIFETNLANQLVSEGNLLQRELRFSGVDIAAALTFFGEQAKELVKAKCATANLGSQCSTVEIDLAISNYRKTQPVLNATGVDSVVKALSLDIKTKVQSMNLIN